HEISNLTNMALFLRIVAVFPENCRRTRDCRVYRVPLAPQASCIEVSATLKPHFITPTMRVQSAVAS
ncbi:MAG: hypothetical protein JWN30_2878, partial [Bacilli bacterium]|nr:hypothetical protein [Bacilli bacterium]